MRRNKMMISALALALSLNFFATEAKAAEGELGDTNSTPAVEDQATPETENENTDTTPAENTDLEAARARALRKEPKALTDAQKAEFKAEVNAAKNEEELNNIVNKYRGLTNGGGIIKVEDGDKTEKDKDGKPIPPKHEELDPEDAFDIYEKNEDGSFKVDENGNYILKEGKSKEGSESVNENYPDPRKNEENIHPQSKLEVAQEKAIKRLNELKERMPKQDYEKALKDVEEVKSTEDLSVMMAAIEVLYAPKSENKPNRESEGVKRAEDSERDMRWNDLPDEIKAGLARWDKLSDKEKQELIQLIKDRGQTWIFDEYVDRTSKPATSIDELEGKGKKPSDKQTQEKRVNRKYVKAQTGGGFGIGAAVAASILAGAISTKKKNH